MGTKPTEREKLAQLTAWTLSLGDTAFLHQHVVDAWAAQHADEQSKPISVAFALIGLYLYLEKGFSGREVQKVHMRLAQPHGRGPGRKHWPKFPIPEKRGDVTISDVISARHEQRVAAIQRWCCSVWNAWRESHEQVRAWAAQDLGIVPR